MSYDLEFHPDALKEWQKLPKAIKEQFKKALKRRLINPHVPSTKLHDDLKNCFKIKLLKAGYRLVYHIKEDILVVTVIAVGKRDDNLVYRIANIRN